MGIPQSQSHRKKAEVAACLFGQVRREVTVTVLDLALGSGYLGTARFSFFVFVLVTRV
jgi:hypothetical protein